VRQDSGARSGALVDEGTKNSRILIADGDNSLLVYMRELLARFGYEVFCSDTGEKAIHLLRTVRPAIVFLDLHLPGKDGLETLQQMKRLSADTYIVMMSGDGLAKAVVTTMKMGAMDFLHKPFDQEELLATVGKQMDRRDLVDEAKFLREEIKRKAEFNRLFQNSEKMQEIQAVVEQVADTDITLLIQGESGTGKELVARAIYTLSARRDRPFLKVNCAALPEPLLESEMFGYEKGAFTDASSRKPGKFELADGGTIFLDEISEMMPSLQAKLLQVLQDKQFTHLGGKQDIRVDVRIIAATNQNLSESVAQGRFREDLYYRLNVVNIHVAPLRERKEEIPVLVEYFTKKYTREFKRKAPQMSTELLDARHRQGGVPGIAEEVRREECGTPGAEARPGRVDQAEPGPVLPEGLQQRGDPPGRTRGDRSGAPADLLEPEGGCRKVANQLQGPPVQDQRDRSGKITLSYVLSPAPIQVIPEKIRKSIRSG